MTSSVARRPKASGVLGQAQQRQVEVEPFVGLVGLQLAAQAAKPAFDPARHTRRKENR
jgi:hypothetical protein